MPNRHSPVENLGQTPAGEHAGTVLAALRAHFPAPILAGEIPSNAL
jgi:hypothetical protein